VERGFSINKETLSDNMRELSLVSQRHVQDTIEDAGGIFNVVLS
jgi:hypothetical protein